VRERVPSVAREETPDVATVDGGAWPVRRDPTLIG